KIVYGANKPALTFDIPKTAGRELETEAAAAWHTGNNWWPRMISRVQGADRRWFPKKSDAPTLADASSSDGLVRLHTASAMQRLPLNERFAFATALAAHAEDANDRQQPLMIWYGIEPAVTVRRDKAVALVLSSKIPTVRRLVTRRLTEEIETNAVPLVDLLAAALK